MDLVLHPAPIAVSETKIIIQFKCHNTELYNTVTKTNESARDLGKKKVM